MVIGPGFLNQVPTLGPTKTLNKLDTKTPCNALSLLQQPGPKKFKLSKIELIYKDLSPTHSSNNHAKTF